LVISQPAENCYPFNKNSPPQTSLGSKTVAHKLHIDRQFYKKEAV